MGKKLISLDLDGTILIEQHKIEEKLIFLLKRFTDKGDIILFNTGRTYAYSKFVFKPLDFPFYGSFSNGVALAGFPGEDIIYEVSMPEGLIKEICELFLKHRIDPVFQGGLHNNDKTFNEVLKFPNRELLEIFSVDGDRRIQVESLSEFDSKDFVSVFGCSDNPEEAVQLAGELNGIKGLYSVAFVHSYNENSYWITAGSQSINKGVPVKKLAEKNNVKREDIYVFGNDLNDIPMLAEAGHPVTIEDSPKELKEISESIVSGPDKHGILNYLEQISRQV